jgi:hypothetical protein
MLEPGRPTQPNLGKQTTHQEELLSYNMLSYNNLHDFHEEIRTPARGYMFSSSLIWCSKDLELGAEAPLLPVP